VRNGAVKCQMTFWLL